MSKIKAQIVADSLSPQGDRLTSVLITFPRIILAEVNTHRMLSKNTSSSRAIPFNKMVEAVQNDPFIPIAWQKDHKGMQGSEYFINEIDIEANIIKWNAAKERAITTTKGLYDLGVTKQLCNRLLEPFIRTTMLITGSKEGWGNFFNLRCPQYHFDGKVFRSRQDVLKHVAGEEDLVTMFNDYDEVSWLEINKGQAEIHMMALAEQIWDAMNESTPKQLQAGEWHIPFENEISNEQLFEQYGYENPDERQQLKVKVSSAMAAHTSYTTVGSEPVKSYEKWIELHDKLIAYQPPHSSPLEHCARAMSDVEYSNFIKGQIDTEVEDEDGLGNVLVWTDYKNTQGWCRNFRGFIQYRHIIEEQYENNKK